MEDPAIRKQFEEGLDQFVERAKKDNKVLGVILYGSLAYDEVTSRSNVNIYVITKEGQHKTVRLVENGVPFDVDTYSRDAFIRTVQSRRGVTYHQLLSYSKLLFSCDESLTDFYNNLSFKVGKRDLHSLLVIYHQAVLYDFKKSEKYLFIKDDVAHSFHFFVHGMNEMGYLLCYLNEVFPPREVMLKGREFEPELYREAYDNLIQGTITKESLEHSLKVAYKFLDSKDLECYRPVLDFISNNEGTATQDELVTHFTPRGLRHFELESLHRRRILRRTVAPTKLTRKGAVDYNEPQYHFSWSSFDSDTVIPTQVGPSDVDPSKVRADYQAAIEELAAKAKSDEYVLALILGGSLAYDKVWEKSDLDTCIITRDEVPSSFKFLLEKDVYLEANVMTRDDFRKLAQRATDGSVFHSYMSKGKPIFTRDESLFDLYEDIHNMGSRDLENLVLLNYVFCKDLINKAWKALHVKNDPVFSINFIMPGLRRMANIEVLLNRQIPLRESTAQALELNPEFFNQIFTYMVLKMKKDKESLSAILTKMELYLNDRLDVIVQPILRLLEKETELMHHDLMEKFNQIRLPINLTEFVDMGLLNQVEAPFRFTKKSTTEMIQPAYQSTSSRSVDDLMI